MVLWSLIAVADGKKRLLGGLKNPMRKRTIFKVFFYMTSSIILYAAAMSTIYIFSYSLIIRTLGERHELKYYAVILMCVIFQSAALFVVDKTIFHVGFRVHKKFKDYFLVIIIFVWMLIVVTGLSASMSSNLERELISAEMESRIGIVGPLIALIWPQFYIISAVFPAIIERVLTNNSPELR